MVKKYTFKQVLAAAALLIGAVSASAADAANVSVVPAEGDVVALQHFTLTFDGATTVAYTANSTETSARLSGTGDNTFGCTFMSASIEGNAMTFAIPESYLDGIVLGTYQLVLPAGSYTVDDTEGEPLVFTYTVAPVKYSVSPLSPIVEALDTVQITFIGVDNVVENYSAFATIKNAAGEIVPTTTSTAANVLSIVVREPENLTNGIYLIDVPANSLDLDGVTYGQAITLQKTLNLPLPEFTDDVFPAQGNVGTLKDFTVTFGGENVEAALIAELGTPVLPYVTNATGERVRTAIPAGFGLTDNVLTFSINEIDEPGVYALHIPGELYTINGITGVGLDYVYTVVEAPKFAVYPKQSEVSEFSAFEIEFADGAVIEEVNAPAVVCLDETAQSNVRVSTAIEGNVYLVTVVEPLANGHYYTFTVPAGTLKVNGESLDVNISKTYLYTPDLETNFTVAPAEGIVSSIGAIEITFADATAVAVTVNDTPSSPYISKVGGDRIRTLSPVNDAITAEGNVLSINFSDVVTEAGEYQVTIPAAAYTLDGVQGSEIVLSYTVDGTQDSINSINAANSANATIYTINGVKVNARSMGRGLYIINGVKTIVK